MKESIKQIKKHIKENGLAYLFLFNFIDFVLTTYVIIPIGGEGNPIMRYFYENFNIFMVLLIKMLVPFSGLLGIIIYERIKSIILNKKYDKKAESDFIEKYYFLSAVIFIYIFIRNIVTLILTFLTLLI